MEEEKELQGEAGTLTGGVSPSKKGRPGPTWRGWMLSILVAIALSVTATLLLARTNPFNFDGAAGNAAAGGSGCGPGGSCCPPAGK